MIGVRLAGIAVELDDLATQVEERGITDADRLLLVSGHRHLELAVESLNLALGAIYQADERELRWSAATDAELADVAAARALELEGARA